MENVLASPVWPPDFTDRAEKVWAEYQKQHDLSQDLGRVAAIDPVTERVWVGDSGINVVEQMEAEGIHNQVHFVRVGYNYFVRKG